METIKRILLATDGSDHALHAAAFAGMLSRETGAKLDIVTVHNDDAVMLNAMGPAIWPATVPYSAMSTDEIRQTVEQHATDTILPDTVKACGAGACLGAILQLWGQVSVKVTSHGFRCRRIGTSVVQGRCGISSSASAQPIAGSRSVNGCFSTATS